MKIILLISLCAASISFTITTTSMFKWFRELVSPIHKKVEELVHCPWCLSHWTVLIILLSSGWHDSVYDFLFTLFACTTICGLIHYVLLRAYEPVAKEMARRHIDKMQKDVAAGKRIPERPVLK
jgi:accessory gene regulator protein AgrB